MGGSVPDIPGIRAAPDLTQSFRYEVANVLGRKQTSFAGAQPVSFAAKHFSQLQKQDYYVCEKSDGVRCLMYLTDDGQGKQAVYLIDRKNDYYFVPELHFPKEGDETEFHTGSIVDGELVNDTQPNGTIEMKYLVFDCLVLDNNSLMHRTLDKRLAYFRDKVYKPYQALYERYPDAIQHLPFLVKFKQMEFSYALERMFNEILPSLPHGNDGLIFTCRNSPYVHGTDEQILKWKPETENSIDFRMHLQFPIVDAESDDEDDSPYPDYSAFPQANLSVFGGDKDPDKYYGTMVLEPQEWEMMISLNRPLNHRIVECYLDKQHQWRFLRFRDDKKEANHISTVESVMQSIQDKVSKQDLINQSPKIREEWKKRLQAAEQASAKKEQEAKKAAAMAAQRNVSDGQNGLKRKFEGSETAGNGAADD
ncbi:MAG: hypothetical protein Q9164_004999 [Protoblastenia rupestris]